MNNIPAGPILLNILCKSSNLTGPDEEVTSLIASAPRFVAVKFPALKSLDWKIHKKTNKWLISWKKKLKRTIWKPWKKFLHKGCIVPSNFFRVADAIGHQIIQYPTSGFVALRLLHISILTPGNLDRITHYLTNNDNITHWFCTEPQTIILQA